MSKDSLAKSGIGLRSPHVRDFLSSSEHDVGFLEVHTENYIGGGKPRADILQIAKNYSISLHCVGASLGRADGLDKDHIQRIKNLADEINPIFISDHLSWSGYQHTYVPDLLPVPFTNEALNVFVDHVSEFQDIVGRQMLVENPSNYVAFKDLDYSEMDFLNEISTRTGCGLLLDINNIKVSSHNLGYDPIEYLNTIKDDGRVKEMHLAGYQVNKLDSGEEVYLDTHGAPVYEAVWELYEYALKRFGDTPTLMEWDTDVPELDILLAEAQKADDIRLEAKQKGGVDNVLVA